MFNRLLCVSLVLSIACKRDTLDVDPDTDADADTAFDVGTDTDDGTDADTDEDTDTDADTDTEAPVDADNDGFTDDVDCDDSNADIHPEADELCNGVDDNCDEVIDTDAVDQPTGFADLDRDGYGDPNSSLTQCALPRDYVSNDLDCAPDDVNVNPDAPEICNSIDDNCSGIVDDVDDLPTYYADFDNDLYGDPDHSTQSCIQPRGFVAQAGDCAPDDAAIHPDAIEICNSIDDNCNGIVDTDTPTSELPTWYRDADRDLYGDPADSATACVPPGRDYVQDSTDCAPDNADVNPGADEVCNGMDDNCDRIVDTDAIDRPTWYADRDRDGFGDPASAVEVCIPPSLDYVQNDEDCGPGDNTVNPDAPEVCDDVDHDCSGLPNDNEAIGSAAACAVQDCWSALDEGLASGPTWVYWGQRTAFEVYCEQEVDGGGWGLFFKNHGGEVPGELSNATLLEGDYNGTMVAPHDEELVSDVNTALWSRVRGEPGLQFLKMGTLYAPDGAVEEQTALRVSFNNNTWDDIFAAPSNVACTQVDTPFVVTLNGTTSLGSTTFINSYQSGRQTFGLANNGHGTDDSCRQDVDNLITDPTDTQDVLPRIDGGSSMNGIRHLFSYVHTTRTGRDFSRCQFGCWQDENFGGYYDGFTWGVRAPRR